MGTIVYGNSVLSVQFYYESKTALKIRFAHLKNRFPRISSHLNKDLMQKKLGKKGDQMQ